MLCELGPVGVPKESRYFVDWASGGRAPTSFTTSGASTATATRRTMNAAAASATRSLFRRRQNSWSGERAAIAGWTSSRSGRSPPPGASRAKSTLPVSTPSADSRCRTGFDGGEVTPRFASAELAAHPLQRAADQTRDVHLRDADALRDLRLCEALLKPHAQDLALALRERRQRGLQRGAVVGALVPHVLGPDGLHRVELVLAGRRR